MNPTQTNTTPYMQSPLIDKLGSCGRKQGAKDILNGKLDELEGVTNVTREVLAYLQLKEEFKLNTTPNPILTSDCQSG